MPIGASRYTKHDLTPLQREALYRSARQLADLLLDDLRKLARREVQFAGTDMAEFLPRKHLNRYDLSFAQRSLVCVLTVAWKLREPRTQWLACTAEELALRAIIQAARALLLADPELDEAEANFTSLESVAFEDWDFEMLFDPAFDGVEDSSDPQDDVVNLHFDKWFNPSTTIASYTRTWMTARANTAGSGSWSRSGPSCVRVKHLEANSRAFHVKT